VVKERRHIVCKYLRTSFGIDLVSAASVLIYLFGENYGLRFVRIIFYIKMWSLVGMDEVNLKCFTVPRIFITIYRFARMVGVLLVLVDWAACIFFAIDYHFCLQQGMYYQLNQLWLLSNQAISIPGVSLFDNFPWYIWLQYSFYWSVQTSATIGYGDLTSRNPE